MTKYSKSSVLCWHLLSLSDENNMHPVPQKNSIIKEGDQREPGKAVEGMSLWGKIVQVFIYDLRLPSADNKRHGG